MPQEGGDRQNPIPLMTVLTHPQPSFQLQSPLGHFCLGVPSPPKTHPTISTDHVAGKVQRPLPSLGPSPAHATMPPSPLRSGSSQGAICKVNWSPKYLAEKPSTWGDVVVLLKPKPCTWPRLGLLSSPPHSAHSAPATWASRSSPTSGTLLPLLPGLPCSSIQTQPRRHLSRTLCDRPR